MDDTEWDDTTKNCICLEEGAEFHGDHCESKQKKAKNSAKWIYGIVATAIIRYLSFSEFSLSHPLYE